MRKLIESKLVAVDCDGVLAHHDKRLLEEFTRRHPNLPSVPYEQRTWNLVVPFSQIQGELLYYPFGDTLPLEDYQQMLTEINAEPDFYTSLEPIEGAIEGMNELRKYHNVIICTGPNEHSPTCRGQKYEWIKKHLGPEWANKSLHIGSDKTVFNADYLIDDKPRVRGILGELLGKEGIEELLKKYENNPRELEELKKSQSLTEHILFAQATNQHIEGKRKMDWHNYKQVLPELFPMAA